MNTQKLYQRLDTPGSTPLWQVFWIYGVAVSHLLFGSILFAYNALETPLLGVLLFAFVLYTGWVLNAVWRNADNVANPLYGQIARFLTVAWSLNAVLVSIFLFLGHLGAVVTPLHGFL